MSYILDALRKADQQRQRDTAPTLMTAQATVAAPGKPLISLNVWLAAILVVAGMVIGWLRPWQTEAPVAKVEPIAARPAAPIPTAAAPEPVSEPASPAAPMPAPASPEKAGQSDQPPAAPMSASAAPTGTGSAGAAPRQDTPPLPAKVEIPPPPPGAVIFAPRDAVKPVPEQTVGAGMSDAGQDKPVMALSELPASVRQQIPNLTIAFHFYAERPAERRVMINNELLRQGEVLEPGLVVEQITRDGVVLSYKGYRFQRGVR